MMVLLQPPVTDLDCDIRDVPLSQPVLSSKGIGRAELISSHVQLLSKAESSTHGSHIDKSFVLDPIVELPIDYRQFVG